MMPQAKQLKETAETPTLQNDQVFAILRDVNTPQYATADLAANKITIQTQISPEAFWKAFTSVTDPSCWNFQSYSGDDALYFLTSDGRATDGVLLTQQQSDPNAQWNVQFLPNYQAFAINYHDLSRNILVDMAISGQLYLTNKPRDYTPTWQFW